MIKLCECGCGNPTTIAKKTDQRRGDVKGQPMRFIRGHNSRVHRLTDSPEYDAYHHAKNRCTDPKNCNWKYYGGRGIQFRFTRFEQFYAELGPRPAGKTLDRINNDGHYEPGNVRWATRQEQIANQRHFRKAA